MSKTHIIILRESLVESIISDMVTASTTIGLIGIGILLDSAALQFVGAIMVMLVLVEMSIRRGRKLSIEEARAELDRIERASKGSA